MPNYSEYGFAVFQLNTTLSNEEDEIENIIHPMAFEFPTCNSKKLFCPTVHVHNGNYHKQAEFCHTIYCQRDNARSEFKYEWDLLHGKNQLRQKILECLAMRGMNGILDQEILPQS